MTNEKLNYKVDIRQNMRNLYLMAKPYRTRFFLLLGTILVVEASYVYEKYLFKVVIDSGTEYSQGALAVNPFLTVLMMAGGAFLIALAIRSALKWVNIHLINKLDSALIVDLKRKFFNHIIHLSHRFHTGHKTGSMISRLARGSGAIESLMDVIVFNFAPMTFMFIVAAAAVFTVDRSAAIVMAVMVVVFVAYGVMIQRIQLHKNVYANHLDDVEKANVSDFFTNIESIKYYGKERSIKRRFRKLTQSTIDAYVEMWNYFRYMDAGHALIIGISAFMIVAMPLRGLLMGTHTVGDITFIYTVYMTLMGPLFGFMHGIRQFYRAMADFESLFQYDRYENEIKDMPGANGLRVRHGRIEFRDVEFGYRKKKLFCKFNLKVDAHQKVAFVGHSGSGKSTLVKLLYRLYDVDKGAILIDGKDIRSVKQEALRSELSIVPQEAVLFDDTIYNNIRFSRPSATRRQVMRAIRFAQLDKVIKNLPDGEHTIVGERGVKLSGGEKQRVSIARALLADKRILVLDEATSALDSQTEHEIQQDLEKLMKGRTSIIIAHRLSTIMHADKIVVLNKGRIVQAGTHRQLIRKDGAYKKLWQLQKGGYIA